MTRSHMYRRLLACAASLCFAIVGLSGVLSAPADVNLKIEKSVSNQSPALNELVTYYVTVTNEGPDVATDVVISETIPTELVYVTGAYAEGEADLNLAEGVISWRIPTMTLDTVGQLTITMRVPDNAAGIPISNTALILSQAQNDTMAADNSATVVLNPTTAQAAADLSLIKTVNNLTPNVGDIISYTLVIANNGTYDASNIVIEDILPDSLVYLGSIPNLYDTNTGLWAPIPMLGVGGVLTLTIDVGVIGQGLITNTAVITASDQSDPNTTDNISTIAVEVSPNATDVTLSKTVSNNTPETGELVQYDVVIYNNGPEAAWGVTITNALPTGMIATGLQTLPQQQQIDTAFDPDTQTVNAFVPVIGPQQSITITLQAYAEAYTGGLPLVNQAMVILRDSVDNNLADNMASLTITPQLTTANLVLTSTVSDPTPVISSTVFYTVAITNLGADTARQIVVTQTLPAELTLVPGGFFNGGQVQSAGENSIVWLIDEITPGTSYELRVPVQVDATAAGQTITHTVLIESAATLDPISENDTTDIVFMPNSEPTAIGLQQMQATSDHTLVWLITLTLFTLFVQRRQCQRSMMR